MPEWHQLDSSSTMPQQQESIKKKTLKSSSRSFWFSTGLYSKFYRRYNDLIFKFQIGLKSLMHQVLSEPLFYDDLVYKLKKIVGSHNFSAQFINIISHYIRLAIP